MNVDELIEALKTTGLHGLPVVIDSILRDTRDAEEQTTPDKPPPLDDTYPVVSVVGASHDSPVIISARLIETPPPPEQAPLDPGYPGQLSPPPPEFITEEEPQVDAADEESSPRPLKTSSATKKKP